MPRICLLGAGSTPFVQTLLTDMLRFAEPGTATTSLRDTDEYYPHMAAEIDLDQILSLVDELPAASGECAGQ